MSLGSSTNRKVYTTDGATTIWAFPYLFYDNSHLQVYVDGALQVGGYTVSGAGDSAGGSVTITPALAASKQLLILRVVPETQGTVLGATGPFPAKTVEKSLDLGIMVSQQYSERIGRALKIPATSTLVDPAMPDPALAANAGKIVRVRADLLGYEYVALSIGDTAGLLTTKGDLLGYASAAGRAPVGGTNGMALKVRSTDPFGWAWEPFYDEVTTKGDLLVATAADIMARKGAGANGTVVAADSNTSDGLKYVNVGLPNFRGVVRSHPDSDSVNTKIRADLEMVTTNDGHYYAPAQGLIFDKSVTGSIGGMQAAAVNSTWNKLYYLRKRSDGSEGLWGVRAKNYLADTSFTTARDASRALRLLTSTATDRLAQGIQFVTGGKHEFLDVELVRAGSVSGNIWFSIQADSAGNPSGTPLATTDKYNASRIPTANTIIRIPFRTPFTASASTQYHLVMEGDYAKSDTVFISWRGVAAGGYANGSGKQYNGSAWSAATGVGDFYFVAYTTQNDTALSAPAGYDQFVQIGWLYIDENGNIKRFVAHDRHISTSGASAWSLGSLGAGLTFADLSTFLPPIHPLVWFTAGNNSGASNNNAGPITSTDLSVSGTEEFNYGGAATGASTGPNQTGFTPFVVEYNAAYFASTNSFTGRIMGFEW